MYRRSSSPDTLFPSESYEHRDSVEHKHRHSRSGGLALGRDDGGGFQGRSQEERGRGGFRAWATDRPISGEQRAWRGGRGRGGYYDGRGRGHNRGGFRGRGTYVDRGHHREGHRGRGRGRGGGGRGLNLTQLEELKEKDPSIIVMTLGLDQGIGIFLKRQSLNQREVYTIASLIAKACRCTTAPGSFNRILLTIQESKFYEHVSSVLESFDLFSLCEAEGRNLIRDLTIFMKELYVRLPHSAMEMKVLGLESLLTTAIHKLQRTSDIIDQDILSNIKELQELKITVLDHERTRRTERDEHKEGVPPDDFRHVSIFPSADDIHPNEKPFLRKNKSVGGYRDLDHYLDVQFRLLREDFICPLREGIEAYLVAEGPGKRGQRLKDIRVYQDVHIVRTLCSNNGLLHRLSFDVSNLQRVRWENTKRLIYGSLVCLSTDNFDTLLFATITERDPILLKKGYVDVLFEESEDLDERQFDTNFVMVETTAFFEAYRHVLRGLQKIQKGELPFERYIVACKNDVKPPRYLQETLEIDGRSPKFDLRPLIDDVIELREDKNLLTQRREVSYFFSLGSQCAKRVHVLDNIDWPSPEILHVDNSQFQALKTALTKEFSIIQGPPGTGKTYVGLKIVKALLHNDQMWKKQHRAPMLIVCYTNHALDQFLEGIIGFYKGSVIRVGSRISNEQLERCSLRAHRQSARKDRDKDRDMRNVGKRRWETKHRMLDLQYQIEDTGMKLEDAEKTVMHEDVLKPYMHKGHYDTLLAIMKRLHRQQQLECQMDLPFPRSFIVEWLGVGSMEETIETFGDEGQGAFQQEEDDKEDMEIDIQEEAEVVQAQRKIYDLDTDDISNEFEMKQQQIKGLQNQRYKYVAFDVATFDTNPMLALNTTGFQFTKKARKNIKRRMLKQLKSTQRMRDMAALRVRDPWRLKMEDRWKLYRNWVYKFCKKLQKDIRTTEQSYREAVAEYKELQVNEDMQILREATVIGMTTTAAARYQQALAEIGPRIIVVEEAAEVLEGHIITTLSKKCEHLILIGDHKQLKPNPTVYKLAKQFNLDLSLFERMIDNGIHCDTLALQHRMRPEISTVMRHIYPKLQDHPSVFDYEKVKGISANMFFIEHSSQEEHDMDMMSHSNTYEATYIVALCSYLLKQGYEKSQITVLTTYSGQLLKLKKMMKPDFQGVRLTVVDNYQGEENDIILLSLVRSNAEGSVGFLKIENRICVALSRAKIGLFVIGNFELLSQQSLLWMDILTDLKKNSKVGPTLNLYCQNHPTETGISVQSPDDFKKAPEGGCLKPCVFRLECGHVCALLCHPYDPQHKDYICKKQCSKQCSKGHPCSRYCHEECGKCYIRVETVIPKCQHKQMVPCFKEPSEFSCEAECMKLLDCGHRCGNPCGMSHGCTAKVKKTFRCGHIGDVLCARKLSAQCEAKCSEPLKCGHKCEGDCTRCHEGRLHVPCRKMCKETLICGHPCGSRCSDCPQCRTACANRCQHTKCRKYCNETCDPCSQPCGWQCEHHRCTLPCSEPCDRPPCNEPCKKKLPCKHPCIGLCGEPCPKQCGICNEVEVNQINPKPGARFVFLEDCGHIEEVSKLDHYMKSKSEEIKLKSCPHCDTVIRHNVRYGTMVKKTLKNIESVKKLCNEKKDTVPDMKNSLTMAVMDEEENEEDGVKTMMLRQAYTNSVAGLSALENQFCFVDALKKIIDKYRMIPVMTDQESSSKEANMFYKWLKTPRQVFSKQEQYDAENELLRHKAILLYLDCFQERQATLMQVYVPKLKDILLSGKPYTKEKQDHVKLIFQRLREIIPSSKVEEIEHATLKLVCNVGAASGKWFSCLRGHVYSTGDVQPFTTCPKCKARDAKIQRRRLLLSKLRRQ
ncbi:NFX1-type zinc finger-containing protein 1-like [Haliotis rufescens]|uniref:NFX1-type zinc finger-containing protein 1-like n=1 Tax=Haliotis rufescens TaxID=6454 RepID=UPI001EB04C06|nr:NFX1-type zinc finger-containing protein 1-like [Haliotis rufescens]XP_046375691.1 NFX1-type zinc finger-containing protein 1-like [Haliotis rufescens]XP_046375692.1 NFX1-type zinc finger-containing protein 1-like [Haliotis rufescens]